MEKQFNDLLKEGWIEMPIESQASTKEGNNTVLRKIKKIEGKNYSYKYLIRCNDCGHIFIITRLTRGGQCPNCRHIANMKKYEGQIVNNYEILNFDHVDKNSSGTMYYFKVKCLKCGEISILSRNSIFYPVKASGCKKCYYSNRVGKEDTPKHTYYLMYKRKAIERGLSFDLSEESFYNLISKPCYYCNQPPTYGEYVNKNFNKSKTLLAYNGVDRIDGSKGYSSENCVPCCTMCNRMKLNYTQHDFFQKIKNIYEFLKLDGGLTTSLNDVASSECEMGGILTGNAEDGEIV